MQKYTSTKDTAAPDNPAALAQLLGLFELEQVKPDQY